MRFERAAAASVALTLASLFIASAVNASGDKLVALVQVDAVVFKENGRLDPKVVAECDIEQALRKELDYVQRDKKSRGTAAEARGVTLRIDKIGNLGSIGRAGTELGVTVIPRGSDTGPLLLCQAKTTPFQLSHCERITDCVRKISDDIVDWARRQSKP
jgi:hypothetical protein